MSAAGWAIITPQGEIMVKTVSTERRGAIVNWLVVEHGVAITNAVTEEQINVVWEGMKGEFEAVPVTIARVLQ